MKNFIVFLIINIVYFDQLLCSDSDPQIGQKKYVFIDESAKYYSARITNSELLKAPSTSKVAARILYSLLKEGNIENNKKSASNLALLSALFLHFEEVALQQNFSINAPDAKRLEELYREILFHIPAIYQDYLNNNTSYTLLGSDHFFNELITLLKDKNYKLINIAEEVHHKMNINQANDYFYEITSLINERNSQSKLKVQKMDINFLTN